MAKISNAIESVLGPVQSAIGKVMRPIGNFFAGFGEVGSLKAKLQHLEEELAALQQGEDRVDALLQENDSLRKLLDLKQRLGYQTRAAQVIGRDPSNFEHALLIDGGSRDGFRKDMPVVAADGLVGRIVAVSSSTATVELIVNRDSSVAVRIPTSGEVGSLDGTGGPELRLEILDPNADVTAQDQVVTSGESSIYPPDIQVGTVTRVDPPGGNVTRQAFVDPAVDFSSLDFVLVVVDPHAADRPEAHPAPTATPSPPPSASPSPHPSRKPAAKPTGHPTPTARATR
jgi:rod shape-determining protein MreC